MYAEETVGFCSKASQVPHTMQRTSQFCQLCDLCRFAKILRKFAAHFCCALCRSGSALTTRHCQGHQPSPGWSAAHHLLRSISIRDFTSGNARSSRSDIHSSPRVSKRLWPICVRLFQAPAQWLEMRELHQAFLQKSSAREPRNGESMRQQVVSEKKLESAWLTVVGC